MNSFRKNSSLMNLLVIYSALMLINCILTESPYSAWHSGKVGAYSSSTIFTFNIAYVLLFSVVVVFIVKGFHIYKHNTGYYLCFIIIFSGLLNGNLFNNYNTYFFDTLMFFLISNLALKDALHSDRDFCDKEFGTIGVLISTSLIIGLLLTVVGNGKYGYLPFDFTRASRGEVTWWVILFSPVLLVIITTIKKMNNDRIWGYYILSGITFIVVLSTSSRTMILLFLITMVLYAISQKFTTKKIVFVILGILSLLILWERIWGFFSLGSNSLETVLNGRYGLWELYWKAFLSNPIIGHGPNVYIDASVGAYSEIGLLKDLTHYGIFFGVISIFLIIRGVLIALKVIKNYTAFSKFDTMLAFINIVSVITIIQQHARILQFSDYLCWYSIFYMNALHLDNYNKRGLV